VRFHSAYAEYVCVAADRIGPKTNDLNVLAGRGGALAAITALQGANATRQGSSGAQGPLNGASGGGRHVRGADAQALEQK